MITAVLFSPDDPATAYASGLSHHYISRDQGRTWEISSPGEGISWGPVGTQPGYPLELTADPNNPGTLYTLTDLGGVYRSQDEGTSWAEAGSGYSAASIRSLSVDPTNPGIVYALSAAGHIKAWTAAKPGRASRLRNTPLAGADP